MSSKKSQANNSIKKRNSKESDENELKKPRREPTKKITKTTTIVITTTEEEYLPEKSNTASVSTPEEKICCEFTFNKEKNNQKINQLDSNNNNKNNKQYIIFDDFDDINLNEENPFSIKSKEVKCKVCLEKKEIYNFYSMGTCGHSCCFNCFDNYVGIQFESKKLPIKCYSTNCQTILDLDLMKIFLDKNQLELYVESLSNKHINSNPIQFQRCLTPSKILFILLKFLIEC
jgi:hypothetical protein